MEGWHEQEVLADMGAELRKISDDSACQVPTHLLDGFTTEAMFHTGNIRKAIARLKRGSSPGVDKVSADLVLLLIDDTAFLQHLQRLFLEWHHNGRMVVGLR